MNVKLVESSSVMWVSYGHYNILREQSVRQGFRQEFNKFDTLLRMSLVKKKLHNVTM